MKRIFIFITVILLGLLQSCNEDLAEPEINFKTADFTADVAIDWINLERTLVKTTPGFSPPVAARSFGYASLALYESVVAGIRENRSYQGLISEYNNPGFKIENGKTYHWELVANSCMADMMRNLFKTSSASNKDLIDQLEQKYISKNISKDSVTINRSIQFGKKVAEAIYSYAKSDGKEEAYANNFPDYTIPSGPDKWEPTSPTNPIPLQAYWGSVRPFLAPDADNSLIQNFPPLSFSIDSKSLFYLQAQEVYIYSLNLDDEAVKIAKFWSDDPGITATPPGHSMSIGAIILNNENANLAEAAEVFSKIGLAVHDAFISCWKSKYTYNLLRPVSYIKKYIDPNFTTLLNTPPFPEHTSGHSVQTAAAMTVLESYYGSNYSFTDITHQDRSDIDGSPRNFASFKACASEAAISRLYGGIHYRHAIDKGIEQGTIVGNNIARINLKK